MNAFVKALFNCFPLIWMCCNLSLNPKINQLRERCLRSIYSDEKSSFDDLIALDGSVVIHDQNMQRSDTAIFGARGSLKIMEEIFWVIDRN